MAMPRCDGGTSLTCAVGDVHLAAGDFLKAGDHPQQRRLSAAGRTDKHDELALLDIQIDAMDDIHRAVGLADILQLQPCHVILPFILSFLAQSFEWTGLI